MSGELITVEARYQQVFQMVHLSVQPQIAGCALDFTFEGRQVQITLPPMPDNHGPGHYAPRTTNENPFELRASLSAWDAAHNPRWVDIDSIRLSIIGLQFEIPKAAAEHPHIDMTLFDEEQIKRMDEESDRQYYLANRVLEFWLRVVRWKTQSHLINRVLLSMHGGFDGGALINARTGTRFYTPRVGRYIVVQQDHVVTQTEWAEIVSAVKQGIEPPIWQDYQISAKQRIAEGDTLSAILDLAIASEARIRTFMSDWLPDGLPNGFKRTIRRVNMSDVMANWREYGLPDFAGLNHIRTLFEIRNRIMHSGADERADAKFFKVASDAVTALLRAF